MALHNPLTGVKLAVWHHHDCKVINHHLQTIYLMIFLSLNQEGAISQCVNWLNIPCNASDSLWNQESQHLPRQAQFTLVTLRNQGRGLLSLLGPGVEATNSFNKIFFFTLEVAAASGFGFWDHWLPRTMAGSDKSIKLTSQGIQSITLTIHSKVRHINIPLDGFPWPCPRLLRLEHRSRGTVPTSVAMPPSVIGLNEPPTNRQGPWRPCNHPHGNDHVTRIFPASHFFW